MPLEVQQVSKGFPKLKEKLTHSLTPSITPKTSPIDFSNIPPEGGQHAMPSWPHIRHSSESSVRNPIRPTSASNWILVLGLYPPRFSTKKTWWLFHQAVYSPKLPPQKKLPNSSNKPEETHARVAWRGSQSAFQLSSSLPQNNQLSKRKLCKNHPTQLKFWEKHHHPSKWHLQFKGILQLLPQMIQMLLPGQKKSSSNWTNTWGLSKFLKLLTLLNSSQDRLLQMSSYVAILETAKGCYLAVCRWMLFGTVGN